jgi:hypothetical protein
MYRDPMAPSRGVYIARAIRGTISDPATGVEKVMQKCARRWERAVRGDSVPHNRPEDDWERRLHELIGAPWPCPEREAFSSAWAGAVETMAEHGLRVGRQNYGGDDDADPALARSLWCAICHLHPANVVETGVAHGLSSRIMLEALKRTGNGRLWSIDLPPMTILDRRGEVAVAVPDRLREGWAYVEGPSRRRLPPLVKQLGRLELFCHDSLHSTRNTRWELETVWRVLAPGGVVVVDDVDHNWGFEEFLQRGDDREPLWCMADDGQRVFAVARKLASGA